MNRSRTDDAQAVHKASPRCRPSQETLLSRAAFYGLCLQADGYALDEAAALVMERYPVARPFLQRLTRHAVADPLHPTENL